MPVCVSLQCTYLGIRVKERKTSTWCLGLHVLEIIQIWIYPLADNTERTNKLAYNILFCDVSWRNTWEE